MILTTIYVTGLHAMIKALDDVTKRGVPRAQREMNKALGCTIEVSRDFAHVSHAQHRGR